MMAGFISWLSSMVDGVSSRWPLLIYAATWTTLLTVTVAIASFSPEAAFVKAISPASSFSKGCDWEGSFRVPLDLPGEKVCLPAHLFTKSGMDLMVPPIFAAVIVACSACVIRALALWEYDDPALY